MKIFFQCLLIWNCLLLTLAVCHGQQKRFVFSQPKMGSPFTIILYANDSSEASFIASQCFSLVDKYVAVYSDYVDSSELNRLCATAGKTDKPVAVSSELFDILRLAKTAWQKSMGTFDITLGPVTRLWRKARKDKIFPPKEAVSKVLALTGSEKVLLDTLTHSVLLKQAGMQLDLGGIAQGYIAQKIVDFLRRSSVDNALIDVSGDIAAIGAPPGTNGWTVGINMPESADELLKQTLLMSNKAVTTSGDVYQYMEHDGKRYSHIVHPKTGYGVTNMRNVTVIATDGTTADWLTKACSLLPVRKAKKLARQLGVEFLIAEIRKGKLKTYSTPGFVRYYKPTMPL